uniref:C2H2-type domain-containing protein n=1 Tax=Poecilia reticulata TaxID=8081 RepID=A0A3P9NBB0_POERE
QHQQIKVEEKEVYCSQGEVQIELKQETDTCMVFPADEQTYQTESEPKRNQVIFQEPAESENQNWASKPFSCVICEKGFTGKHALNNHIRTHTGEKLFSCVNCGKSFGYKQHLTRHMKIHTPFSCGNCGKSFSQKRNLTQHMMIHTGEKPFSCGNCGKIFSQKSNLTRHMMIHTGEKPFPCVNCGKSFTDKYALNNHIRTHTGEKPFSCVNCGKSFSCKQYLTRTPLSGGHCELSKRFSCVICKKVFSGKYALNSHIRTHTGEKPFSCVNCGKSFSQKQNLTKHMMIHTAGLLFPSHCANVQQQILSDVELYHTERMGKFACRGGKLKHVKMHQHKKLIRHKNNALLDGVWLH